MRAASQKMRIRTAVSDAHPHPIRKPRPTAPPTCFAPYIHANHTHKERTFSEYTADVARQLAAGRTTAHYRPRDSYVALT